MATRGVGVDVVDVQRFAAVLGRRPQLHQRLFTEAERDDARGKVERLAARFAAKEAVLKALGVGLGSVRWHEIEVSRLISGAPQLRLRGAALELARRGGVDEWHLSLSHTATTSIAFVVATSGESRGR